MGCRTARCSARTLDQTAAWRDFGVTIPPDESWVRSAPDPPRFAALVRRLGFDVVVFTSTSGGRA